MTVSVTDVHLTPADAVHVRTGLLAFLSFRYHDLVLDGVALRMTAGGRRTLSFPVRRDGRGREHALVRPVDQAARDAIEAEVFAAVGVEGAR